MSTQSRPESVGLTDDRLPCLILVAGSLAPGCLLPGTDYRVVEIREHWEPEKDGERAVSTVIRFDPLRATNHQPVALEDIVRQPARDEHCAGCGNALHHECEHTEIGCQRCNCSKFVPWPK